MEKLLKSELLNPRHFPYQLDVRWLAPRVWQMINTFAYITEDGEEVVVKPGFIHDFGSVPRLAYSIVPPTGAIAPASVTHDLNYVKKMIQGKPLSRARADDIFLESMIHSGVGWFTRNAAYSAVATFGQHAWDTP
jgi:hypothetical protein